MELRKLLKLKLKMSNKAHERLAQRALSKNDMGKYKYHDHVAVRQNREKCLMAQSRKEHVWKLYNK